MSANTGLDPKMVLIDGHLTLDQSAQEQVPPLLPTLGNHSFEGHGAELALKQNVLAMIYKG